MATEYSDYTADGGALISETEWTRYKAEALRVLADLTFGRIDTTTDTDILAKIDDATFRVADAIYASSQGIASEKIGSYSVAYNAKAQSPDVVAMRALRGTGLTYAGLSVPASGDLDGTLWG